MKTATSVLVPQDGLFLAVSRRNDTTRWGLPGGKVDPGESNLKGAAREFREECGVFAAPDSFEPLWVGLCPGALEPPTDYWVTTYLWVDEPLRPEIMKPEEGFELRWLTREALCDPLISPFAGYNKLVFDAYDVYTGAKR